MASSSSSAIRNEDLLALQAYVTANDATQYDHMSPTTVVLDLTHSNLIQRHLEVRFDLHDTISDLRARIHRKTGTPPHFQHLQITVMSSQQIIADILPECDNEKKLGYYSLQSGVHAVHCIDTDPNSGSRGGQFEDVRLVEKYRMSDEEYNKRRGTLRDWERQKKQEDPNFNLAKHAREHAQLVEAKRQAKLGLSLPAGFEYDSKGEVVRIEEDQDDETPVTEETADSQYSKETVAGMEVGMRCEVQPGHRRGAVAFVGEVRELGGYWVGVRFDEPVGKADGTIKGKRYFDSDPGYAGFLRGKNVQVGDFPERDIMDELDDDSENEL